MQITSTAILAMVGLIFVGGCSEESKDTIDTDSTNVSVNDKQTDNSTNEGARDESVSVGKHQKPASAGYRFETPVRIKAGGEYVAVESPGYACPTIADVDGDGKQDLVVGQFSNGNMQFCKNIATKSGSPEFAKPTWLKTGEDRAVVPGVW